MTLLSKLKRMICKYIVIREWIENGEFSDTDQIVVVGSGTWVVMVKFLFRKSGKRIYCSKLNKKYIYHKKRKWIVFEKALKKAFPQNDSSILLVP